MNRLTNHENPKRMVIAANDDRTMYRYFQLVNGAWVPYKRQVFRNNVIAIGDVLNSKTEQWLWR